MDPRTRLIRTLLAGALLLLGAAVLFTPRASATAATDATGFNGVDVVTVEGLIDAPNASLMVDAIHDAERRHSTLLVFQLDSNGALGDDWSRVTDAMESPIPIAVWIGPAGAHAQGGAAEIALAAGVLSLSSNSTIGPTRPTTLDHPSMCDCLPPLNKHELDAETAKAKGFAQRIDPVLGDLIVGLDGQQVRAKNGPVTLHTAQVKQIAGRPRRQPNQAVRFRKLSLTGQLQHTLTTPWAAYFLFVVGGSLILFEFFTISIGIAGGVGAACLVGACYGFAALPVSTWALALLVVVIVAFGIDIQAGGVGPWTVIGTVCLAVGSWFLYDGSDRLDVTWWIIVLVVVGTVLFMVGGMTAMLRSRFATPTLGREGMIGELGTAEAWVDPDGFVRIRDAVWKARTNRATPIQPGAELRVVAVEGLVLEVEPLEGGARDHRERRRS